MSTGTRAPDGRAAWTARTAMRWACTVALAASCICLPSPLHPADPRLHAQQAAPQDPAQPIAPRRRPARPRTLTYDIEEGPSASGFRPGDRELAGWALQDWERHAGGRLRFVPGSSDNARIRIKWVSPREGQYGETVRQPNGRRIDALVYVHPDTDALGPLIANAARLDPLLRDAIVYLTCLHELGHAIGLSHTSDERDIMYSFQFGGDVREYFYRYRDRLKRRTDIPATSGLSSQDVERLQRR